MMKKLLCLLSGLFCIVVLNGQTYKDEKAPVASRVEDLLQRMNLEEKIQKLSMTGLGDFHRLTEV